MEATEQPQRIMSVYGVDILAHKETIEKKGDSCSLTLVTGLKFNITCKFKLISCEYEIRKLTETFVLQYRFHKSMIPDNCSYFQEL